MKYYFREEIKRVLFSKALIITFLITLASLVFAWLEFVHFPSWSISDISRIYDAIDIFIRIRSSTRASFLVILAPLLAAMVFSDSYLQEKDTGFLRFIYMRTVQSKYMLVKSFVTGIMSGLVIVSASLIVFISLFFVYGIKETSLHQISGAFSWIYMENRVFYALFIILISFIFNFIFSLLSLGVSPWISNRFLAVVFPFIYFLVSGTIFDFLGINKFFCFKTTVLFTLSTTFPDYYIIIYQVLLLLISILLFRFGVLHKDGKNI